MEKPILLYRTTKNKDRSYKGMFRCFCGNIFECRITAIKNNRTKSCGCLQRAHIKTLAKRTLTTHGDRQKRIYKQYKHMEERCKNNHKGYGDRGIKCEFTSYEDYKEWALNNGYDDSLSIERINVNGNYSKENCKFITMAEQAKNKRNNKFFTHNGKTQILADWARELNIHPSSITNRLQEGYKFSDIIEMNIRKGKHVIEFNNIKNWANTWSTILHISHSFIPRRIHKGLSNEQIEKDVVKKLVSMKNEKGLEFLGYSSSGKKL